MKLVFALFSVFLLTGAPLLRAQNPDAAAAIANRQADEERYKQLRSAIEDLWTAQRSQSEVMTRAVDQIRAVREEQVKSGGNYATADDVKKLAEAIKEVDRKRESDKKLILDELSKIAKAVAAAPAPAPPEQRVKPPVPPKAQDEEPPVKPAKGYEYVIRKDDTLSVIARAYAEQGNKITVEDILKANPGLKAERMVVGKKIFIPQK